MLVFYGIEPVLDITIQEDGRKFGLHRDRNPDSGWSELRHSHMNERCKEIPDTPELRQILLEDLAYTFGKNSVDFKTKLKEYETEKTAVSGFFIFPIF